LRDGVKQLHLVYVEIGRILLRREGYTGSLDELRRVAGKFDGKVRASRRSSGTARDESLPPPLHMPEECSKVPDRKQMKRQAESAFADSHTPIQWKHIPDDAQHVLMRNQCRVLMALSLAAQTSPLPGVAELSVTATAKGTRVQAARPFPAGTLMLLPMVPGHFTGRQEFSASAQGGRARGRDCSLLGTVMVGYIMAFTFLGGTAHITCFGE
jgi:hypothetical protein